MQNAENKTKNVTEKTDIKNTNKKQQKDSY